MKRSDRINAPPLTSDRLLEVLAYDRGTGLFTCRQQRGTKRAGDVAGGLDASGYVCIEIDHRRYLAHRLAFLAVTGDWPKLRVDHIDGDRSNNRWSNLRDASVMTNQQNLRRAMSSSSTGLLGAHAAPGGRFRSSIRIAGKLQHIGTFDTAEAAHDAYVVAKRIHHEGCTI